MRDPPRTDPSLDVLVPSTAAKGNYPLIIDIHRQTNNKCLCCCCYLCFALLFGGGQKVKDPLIVNLIVAHLDFELGLWGGGGREGGGRGGGVGGGGGRWTNSQKKEEVVCAQMSDPQYLVPTGSLLYPVIKLP